MSRIRSPTKSKLNQYLAVAFAVVAFSILVQGLTITPLMRRLGELKGSEETIKSVAQL